MTTTIITVLSSVLSLIGVVSVAVINSHSTQKQIESQNNLQLYRLEQLEQKVNKHNNLVERMAIVERDVAVIKQRVEDIDDGR